MKVRCLKVAKHNGLTKKQRNFCEEYIANGYNGTRAYLAAFDSQSTNGAAVEASKLLKRPGIREYINELQKEAFAAACINAERIAMRLGEIAFAEKNDEVYGTQAKLKALDLLQKQLSLQTQKIDADISTEIIITIDEPDEQERLSDA